MAIHRSLDKIATPLSHLPTWFFIIGYPLFWLQLYTHSAPNGVTSPLSWVLFGIVVWVSLRTKVLIPDIRSWLRSNLFKEIAASLSAPRNDIAVEKWFWYLGIALSLSILGIVVLAGLKPIHLIQESDCLGYHYSMPRQHLILGSFAHIAWSADDLFSMPMDFALAPFWFATVLPNKIPQLIIFLGLLGVASSLTSALATERHRWAGPFVVLIILGTHGFGIQMGTGMLDLAVAYLFLASLDSLRLGNWFLAAVEFTFFFWSKPLMPIEATVIMVIWFSMYAALVQQNHWQIVNTLILKNKRQALGLFIILSIVVAGPFIAKSIYYAATPFFPLDPGIMGTSAQIKVHPQTWDSLLKSSQVMVVNKNAYGHGRGIVSFIKHWWLLGVPERGVNNAFDYPLGLTYLLMIGPFLFFLIRDILQRKFSPLSILAAVVWMLWWFASQQSRFLYVPLLIIFIVTIARFERIPRALFICVLISLSLNAFSLWDAHRGDLNRWNTEVLRDEDKQLLELNHHYLEHPALHYYVDWPSGNIAYAQFPVMVHKEDLPHTILF